MIPLMAGRGLQWVEPRRLAAADECITGQVPITGLARLASLLPEQNAGIDYQLRFAVDPKGRCIIDAQISASLHLCCCSCMKLACYHLQHTALVLVVEGEQQAAQYMHGEREPISLADNGRLNLRHLIEDEVLLSLPMAFMHEQGSCPPG